MFNFRNIIVPDERVQINLHVSECCLIQHELLIFPEIDYLEAPLCILGIDLLYGLHSYIYL